jgi:PAS domain S-box-containing protein
MTHEPYKPSDSLFRILMQTAWDVFHLVNQDGIIVYESAAVTRVLGYLPDEMVGRHVLEFVHPEDVPDVGTALPAELSAPGAHRSFTLRTRHKDGSYRWVESYEVNLLDHPDVRAVAVNYRDVTERKVAEEHAVQTQRALQLLLRCTQAITAAENEHDLLQRVCDTAVDVGGFRMVWIGYAGDQEHKPIIPQAHAGDEQGYLAQGQISWSASDPRGQGPGGQVIRSGSPVVIPDFTAADAVAPWREAGQRRGYRAMAVFPLKDEKRTFGILALYLGELRTPFDDELELLQELADNVAHGVLVMRLRSQRRADQQKVARQAALLDKATDAIFVRDLEHRVLYWNKSAERLYEWSADEAVGRHAADLLHAPDGRDAFDQACGKLLDCGEWAGEWTKKSRSGRVLTVEARWTLVRDENGQPECVLAINTDITERKKLEKQFLRAQRLESIGTLAGGIAHDLNNVLTPIMLSLQLLKLQCAEGDSGELIATCEASASRAGTMLKQLLLFSRGAEGAKATVQVPDLLQDVVRITRETFLKQLDVRTRVASDIWSVVGDPTQLHQVLLNLCVNARDAMPRGGTLTLSAENVTLDEHYASMNVEGSPGPYVCIEVQDTGSGIAPDMLDKIFDPFFTTKDVGKGTGLGLSTSLSIVKAHGGFFRVYSELGTGTSFKIYLPAGVGESLSPEPVAPTLPRGNGQLVLVIDDEPSIRQISRQTLEAFGYSVLTAADGAEGIALFAARQAEIQVVIVDMMMPILDGPATIQVLQRLKPNLPIIGASGLAANGNLARAASLGVKHFLQKPYGAADLLNTLRQVLS